MQKDSSDLIGSQETAALLGVHYSTLTRWVERGRIVPAMKLKGLRGAFLFERSEVERVRDADRTSATP